MDALCGAVASAVVCVFAGIVCGGSAEQVYRGYATGGPLDLALVETRSGDLDRSVETSTVFRGGGGHHSR